MKPLLQSSSTPLRLVVASLGYTPMEEALLAIKRWNESCAFTGQRSYTGRLVSTRRAA